MEKEQRTETKETATKRWITPEEYANKYRISLPSLYPALRAGRVPGAKKVMGRAWRIFDDDIFQEEAA
jgi:hypothetical protein